MVIRHIIRILSYQTLAWTFRCNILNFIHDMKIHTLPVRGISKTRHFLHAIVEPEVSTKKTRDLFTQDSRFFATAQDLLILDSNTFTQHQNPRLFTAITTPKKLLHNTNTFSSKTQDFLHQDSRLETLTQHQDFLSPGIPYSSQQNYNIRSSHPSLKIATPYQLPYRSKSKLQQELHIFFYEFKTI